MAKVTIDNQTFEFEGQEKLLQFCLDHGVDLPHFCYHPSMSAPANCRQCLVEVGMPQMNRETGQPNMDEDGNTVIQFMPKLQTSCSMQMSDGMVVKTHCSSETVKRAQKDTLEFLLINHPLDCPICDQAGHCPLQNQAYKHGPEGSRFEFEKVHKPKHIDLGPRVVLDGERCINCTRCIRFTREVSKSDQLTIIERGVKNYPMTPPGVEFDEPYSMNVIDICPVGALTSKDYRFKARIWEMSKTASISAVGAKGSNCDYWVKDNLILKVTPRTNMDVNEYWLADEERADYKRFNEDRPPSPTVPALTFHGTWLGKLLQTVSKKSTETVYSSSVRRMPQWKTITSCLVWLRLSDLLLPSICHTWRMDMAMTGCAPMTARRMHKDASVLESMPFQQMT
ncbi:MAG: 2Fe-2S iron-sulfur cluster-binding protein [Bacteroidetes bacterium]|nr:2Fe-2S iron-sulfur cluster-binding protein [Bacteroidota bacterium]